MFDPSPRIGDNQVSSFAVTSATTMVSLTTSPTPVTTSYGLNSSIWNQMRLTDGYLASNSFQKVVCVDSVLCIFIVLKIRVMRS